MKHHQKQKLDWIAKRRSLRTEAEVMLSSLSPAELTAPAEVLLHELLVHKVELEMQLEELQETHALMEDVRNRYIALYDFSPVGCLAITQEGRISEINLTGAALLGVDRVRLINRQFSDFVSPRNGERWSHLFLNVMEHLEIERKSSILELMRADASIFHAYLDCQRKDAMAAPPILRLVLIDTIRIKQAEAEIQLSI
ncbi:hypothetical protein CCP3SC15_1680004 [Gammaproteobacteria bacterium]